MFGAVPRLGTCRFSFKNIIIQSFRFLKRMFAILTNIPFTYFPLSLYAPEIPTKYPSGVVVFASIFPLVISI